MAVALTKVGAISMSKKQWTQPQTSNLWTVESFDSVQAYIEGFLLKQRSQRHSPETWAYPDEKLTTYPVSSLVNSPANERRRLIEPLGRLAA